MVHIITMVEGFPDEFDNFKETIENACRYDLQDHCVEYEKGLVKPRVRELRIFDIVMKEGVKNEFYSDIKGYAPFSYLDKEPARKGDGNKDGTAHVLHGGKGFPIKLFRKAIQFGLGIFKIKPIKWKDIEPSKNNKIAQYAKDNDKMAFKHQHIMILGELSDGFVKEGRNKGRENS